MRVPHSSAAYVNAAKIRDYLLSPVHPLGCFKSSFFTSLGYSQDSWTQLEIDLRTHLRSHAVLQIRRNVYGTKYCVRGRLRGPSGAAADVIAVWIVLDGESTPRFVTAYPGED